MSPPTGYESGQETARRQLSRHLTGAGIELGPGHMPFPLVMPSTTARYLDAWSPGDSADRFPEVDASAFVEPDMICDFNVDGLAPVPDASQDFAVASHVLEHLANPLRMLCEMHRVLRPGGTVLIILPDRHNTFDRDRPPTPLEHLIAEHEAGVTEVDDAHVEEFILATAPFQTPGPPGTRTVPDPDLDLAATSIHERSLALLWLRWDDVSVPEQRREIVQLHRLRSIHAHVWDVDDFFAVLCHGVGEMGMAWELMDGLLAGDPGGRADEFALVLRRSAAPVDPPEQLARLRAAWSVWRPYRAAVQAELEKLRAETADLQARVAALQAQVDTHEPPPPPVDEPLETVRRGLATLKSAVLRRVDRPQP